MVKNLSAFPPEKNILIKKNLWVQMNIWHKQSLAKVESEPVDTHPSDMMMLEDDFQENSNTPEMITISNDEDT